MGATVQSMVRVMGVIFQGLVESCTYKTKYADTFWWKKSFYILRFLEIYNASKK